jgi:hypothetical protein
MEIFFDGTSYILKCYETKNGIQEEEELTKLYSIKMEGYWTLKSLEVDLFKIINREFRTYRPNFYPF